MESLTVFRKIRQVNETEGGCSAVWDDVPFVSLDFDERDKGNEACIGRGVMRMQVALINLMSAGFPGPQKRCETVDA